MQIIDLNSNSFIHNPYITTVTHAMNAQRNPPPRTPYFHSYLTPPFRNHDTDPNNAYFATEENFAALNCPELPVQRSRLVTRESVRSMFPLKKNPKKPPKKQQQKTKKKKKPKKQTKQCEISLYILLLVHTSSVIFNASRTDNKSRTA